MATIRLGPYSGEAPRMSPLLLGNEQAQIARNVRLTSGEIRPLEAPLRLETPVIVTNALSLHRIDVTAGSVWLSWDTVVHAVKSPVSDVDEGRVYYTGDGTPKKTWYAIASTGGGPYPPPVTGYQDWASPGYTSAPTVSATTGTLPSGTYTYVVTLVNQFGPGGGGVKEETQPSPESAAITLASPGGVTVTRPGGVPAGTHNYTYWRLYRSTPSGDYKQVGGDIPIATTSVTDNNGSLTLLNTLPSIYWDTPPDDMIGVVAMPNGMLAAFRGNELLFSEPYQPHAWPAKYRQSLPIQKITGLGVIGSTLVVLVDNGVDGSTPFIFTGPHPASLTQERISDVAPCLNIRSIVSMAGGVYFATTEGVGMVNVSGQYNLLTRPLYSITEWENIKPENIFATTYLGDYFAYYIDDSQMPAIIRVLWLQPQDTPPLVEMELNASTALEDFFFNPDEGKLYQWAQHPYLLMNGEWKSKQFSLPTFMNFSVMQIQAQYGLAAANADAAAAYAAALAANQLLLDDPWIGGEIAGFEIDGVEIGADFLPELPIVALPLQVIVTLIVDGVVRFSKIVTSNDPFRLPGGYRGSIVEVSINTNIPVQWVKLAESVEELKSVQ